MNTFLKIVWIWLLAHSLGIAQEGLKIDFNLDFPQGTQFSQNGNTLNFTLPSGYYLIGIDAQGNFHRSAVPPNGDGGSGGVTCTCTEGSGGCNPVYSDESYGCLITTKCSVCEKTASIRRADGQEIAVKERMIASVNESGTLTSFSQIQGKRLLSHRFIDAQEVSSFFSRVTTIVSTVSSDDKRSGFDHASGACYSNFSSIRYRQCFFEGSACTRRR